MLAAAVEAAKAGHAVYVVAATNLEARRISRLIPPPLGIKVECPVGPDWNWDSLVFRGMHPNVRVFVDHHAIELRFTKILRELHRYDLEDGACL
jgi:hypothetical protein